MPEEYIVQRGDTLSGIAEKFYGDASKENVDKIFDANRHVGGVGPTADQLNYEHDGKPVVLTIPD